MIRLTFACLRKKKGMILVPLLILWILLPVLCIFFRHQYEGNMEEAVRAFTSQMHTWIPIFSVWWGIALFQDFFESGGNELLYLYHHPPYFLKIQGTSMLLYNCCVAVCFLICRQFMSFELFLMAQLMAEAVFAGAFAYFLIFALLNTGAALITVAAYCIYINLFDILGLLDFMSVFPKDSFATSENIRLIGNTCLSALAFLVIGFLCSKFRREYK